MNTHSCNSCQTPFSDRAIFCSNCQDQLRCKDCREILEPKAHFCILCGNPLLVVSRSEGLILATSNPSDVAANKIDFRKTKSGSQRLIASFSDATSSHFSGVLGQVLVAGLGLKERASNTGLADNR